MCLVGRSRGLSTVQEELSVTTTVLFEQARAGSRHRCVRQACRAFAQAAHRQLKHRRVQAASARHLHLLASPLLFRAPVPMLVQRGPSLHLVPMREIDLSPFGMLKRLAAVGDEAGLAAVLSELDTVTLADTLERLVIAHEAAALAVRDGNVDHVVDYRTALLCGIREMARRIGG